MSLDKQRILSELGSVVNQLQSADCGCMSKLFGNQTNNQSNYNSMNGYHAIGGHGGSCYHGRGYDPNAACGEPYSTSQAPAHCMGRCNPSKLYADTYGYLNQNLMQPTIKEVYNDLKSITPDNTIMNAPMGKVNGLEGSGLQGLTAGSMYGQVSNINNGFGSNTNAYGMSNPSTGAVHNLSNKGGMGPGIMKMLTGESNAVVGKVSPVSQPTSDNVGAISNPNAFQPYAVKQHGNSQPGAQYMTPHTVYATGVQELNTPFQQSDQRLYGQTPCPVNSNLAQNAMQNMQSNPNQNNSMNQTQMTQQASYGQHTAGVKKFNEMFPGVMQGLGGDLGFDPMTIAIQMNPANHKQQAFNMMHNIMNNKGNANHNAQGPFPNAQAITPQQAQAEQNLNQQGLPPNNPSQISNSINNAQNQLNVSQSVPQSVPLQQQAPVNTMLPPQTQQVYYNTQAPVANQEQIQSPQTNNSIENKMESQQYTQQIIDPNAGAFSMSPNLPTLYEGTPERSLPKQSLPAYGYPAQTFDKEPIYPADTTKRMQNIDQHASYNTLGQPVEMLPAKLYYQTLPKLPQTLSPQEITTHKNQVKYSNVKSTVSKTSIMGARPIGRNPSKSQLQNIYNQYKGSQSFTQQNIENVQGGTTHSAGQLNVPQGYTAQQQNKIPVERIGGDTQANVSPEQLTNKVEHVIGQIGDVPQTNKIDIKPEKELAVNNRKVRNGLQDMVFTSYPTSAAWSFHGHGRSDHPSSRGLYRN